MADFLAIVVGAALVNNFVLLQFLGMVTLFDARVSGRMDTALAMSVATGLILLFSALLNHLLYYFLLVPLELEYLRLVIFMLIIGTQVTLIDVFIRRRYALLHERLGNALPLLAANTAILAAAVLSLNKEYSLVQTMAQAIGAAIGFAIVMMLFAGIQQRLQTAAVPTPFRGSAISLISAGLMALGFLGFEGIV